MVRTNGIYRCLEIVLNTEKKKKLVLDTSDVRNDAASSFQDPVGSFHYIR